MSHVERGGGDERDSGESDDRSRIRLVAGHRRHLTKRELREERAAGASSSVRDSIRVT